MSNAHLAMFWGEGHEVPVNSVSHMMLLEESKLSHIGVGGQGQLLGEVALRWALGTNRRSQGWGLPGEDSRTVD